MPLILRVCVTPISPKTSKLDLTDKSNLQVHFGSKAMASLYDLLCYNLLTSTDPLLAYSLISLHVFTLLYSIISSTNTLQMMNQFIQSTLQFLHFIPMIQLTFLENFYILLIVYATPRFLPPPPGTKHKKGPPAENDRRPRRSPKGLLHLYKAAELS